MATIDSNTRTGISADSSSTDNKESFWVRRSTRAQNRPAFFATDSPPRDYGVAKLAEQPPAMVVSPDHPMEDVVSSSSPPLLATASSALLSSGKKTTPRGSKSKKSKPKKSKPKKSKSSSKKSKPKPTPPLPDAPVSSGVSMRISVSEEAKTTAAAAMKMAVVASSTTTIIENKKRKRAESSVVKGTSSSSKTLLHNVQRQRRPTPEECEFVVRELGKLHPEVIEKCREIRQRTSTITTNVANDCKIDKDIAVVRPDGITASTTAVETEGDDFRASSCGDQTNILDGVFSTMLSQNTTAANSTRAFGNFKKAVPDWNSIANDFDGYREKIETAIRCGGLAEIKAGNIVRLCKTLHEEHGSVSLEYLRNKSSEEIKNDLLRHKGLGPKTVSCVLLFTLGRNEFPVDTHVHRIAKQNKWIPPGVSRDAAYEYLNEVIPDHLKLELHCLLVQNGRECHRCAARGKPQFPPGDGTRLDCPMVHLQKMFAAAPEESSSSISISIAATAANKNNNNGTPEKKVKREL